MRRRAPGRGVPEAWRWLGSKLGDVTMGWGLGAAVCLIGAAVLGMAAYQYRVVSQLCKPGGKRPPALRDVRAVPQPRGAVFRPGALCLAHHAGFDARQCGPDARRGAGFAAFSPEPRVIEKVVDGAWPWAGRTKAALHQQRYRIAYPDDFARWQARHARGVCVASAAGAQ